MSEVIRLVTLFSQQYHAIDKIYHAEMITNCCRTCALWKKPRKQDYEAGSLKRYTLPYQCISVDFWNMKSCIYRRRKTSKVISIIDQFSLYNYSQIVKDETAETFIEALKDFMSLAPYPPEYILSDNQTSLCANVKVQAFLKAHNIQPLLSTAWASSSNSLVEQSNFLFRRTLHRAMRTFGYTNWSDAFHLAKYLVNSLVRTYAKPDGESSFQMSALELVTGVDPHTRFQSLKRPDDTLARRIKLRASAQQKLAQFYKDQEERQKKIDTDFTQSMSPDDLVLVKAFPADKNQPVYKPTVYRIIKRHLRNLYLAPLDGSKGVYRAHVKHCKRFHNDRLLELLSPAIRRIFGRYYNIARRDVPFAPTEAGTGSLKLHQTRQREQPSLMKSDSSYDTDDSRTQISGSLVAAADSKSLRSLPKAPLNTRQTGNLSLGISGNSIHPHLLRAQRQLDNQHQSKSNTSTVHSSKSLGVMSTGRQLLNTSVRSLRQFVPNHMSTPEKATDVLSQIANSVRHAPRKVVEILKRPLVKQVARRQRKALEKQPSPDKGLQQVRRSTRKTSFPEKLKDFVLGTRPRKQRKAAVPDAIAEEHSE